MEAGESMDVLESEEVNAYGSVVAEEEEENSEHSVHSEVGDKMSCHVHAFVCRRKFLRLSTFTVVVSSDQEATEVTCSCKGACARKRGRGSCPCKTANLSCGSSCRCNRAKCKNKVR